VAIIKRRVVRLKYRDPSNLDGVGEKTCYGDDEARAFAQDREVLSVTIRNEVRLSGRELDLYLIPSAGDVVTSEKAPSPTARRVKGARLARWHQHALHGARCGGAENPHGCGGWFDTNDPVGLVYVPDREHGNWYHLACAEKITDQVADTSWPHDATLH
jgi:hypothetical protein